METFSALLSIRAVNTPVTDEFPHKGQWRGAFFICVWLYAWVNNAEARDLRRHRVHYNVIVMIRCVRRTTSVVHEYILFSISIFVVQEKETFEIFVANFQFEEINWYL